MNERIDELMRQAGIFKPKEFYQHIDALQLEKFAGLLIKECSRVAKLTETDDGDDYKSGRTWAGDDVLKHFGIEE